MALTRDALVRRVMAICEAPPFSLTPAPDAFDFDRLPNTVLDGAYRVTVAQQQVLGGYNYTEETIDLVTVWVAGQHTDTPAATALALAALLQHLRAAVVRDGTQVCGEYTVVDGGSAQVQATPGRDFSVAQLGLPVDYETQL